MTANSHLSRDRYEAQQPPKGFVVSSNLILIAFATVFFPRLISSLGAPSPINFMHLCVVPVFCAAIIITSKAKDKKQLAIVRSLLIGLLWLLYHYICKRAGKQCRLDQYLFRASFANRAFDSTGCYHRYSVYTR